MTDAWIYFVCGMLTVTPLTTWLGLQIGRERGRQDSLTSGVVPGD